MDDEQDAARLAEFFGIEEPLVIIIDGKPPSKARPRFGRGGHAYTPAESRAAEKRTAEVIKRYVDIPFDAGVALACVFYRPDFHRIDADNMLKHVCDAANGILWADDSQVSGLYARVEVDRENPRTVIVVGPYDTSMNRTKARTQICPQCDKPFDTKWNSKRIYCSRHCMSAQKASANPPQECLVCGKTFQPQTPRQLTCSRACGYVRASEKKSQEKPTCSDCGSPLSKKGYIRCRDCWRIWQAAAMTPLDGTVD